MRLARGLSCSTSSHTWPEVTYPLTLHTSSLSVSTNWNLMCWSWWEEERSCLRVLVYTWAPLVFSTSSSLRKGQEEGDEGRRERGGGIEGTGGGGNEGIRAGGKEGRRE